MAKTGKQETRRSAFWRAHIGGWRKSGESIRGYCRTHGLSESGFHAWKRELSRREEAEPDSRRGSGNRTAPPSEGRILFAEVPSVANGHADGSVRTEGALLEVAVCRGRAVRVWPGFDGETLSRVLRVLEGGAC
jgi:transposase